MNDSAWVDKKFFAFFVHISLYPPYFFRIVMAFTENGICDMMEGYIFYNKKGGNMMNSETLYKDWIAHWLECRRGYVKEATHANYTTAAVTHIIPTLGGLTLGELTEARLQEAVCSWLECGRQDGTGGLSECTVRSLVMLVKLTLKAAAKAGCIPVRQFDILYPKSADAAKCRVLTKEQQITLTQHVYLNLDCRSLGILFCLHTGVRIGELCGLRWGDIDMESRTVQISRTVQRIFVRDAQGAGGTRLIITEPKTKHSRRTIPLSSGIYPVLCKLRQSDPAAYLLTGTAHHTEPRTYREYYDRVLDKLGLAHVNFHGLRHTFATRLIESGADYKTVSELLGHASVNTTLNLYVHPQMEQKRRAVEMLNGIF